MTGFQKWGFNREPRRSFEDWLKDQAELRGNLRYFFPPSPNMELFDNNFNRIQQPPPPPPVPGEEAAPRRVRRLVSQKLKVQNKISQLLYDTDGSRGKCWALLHYG